MIVRTGVDIERVARFENRDASFYEMIFCADEIAYCNAQSFPAQHFCGMFCAKEALSKALSGLVSELSYADLKISHDEHGRPFFILPQCLAGFDVAVSISHTVDTAVASVVLVAL